MSTTKASNRGIVDIEEARQLAEEAGLDLVEISPNSQPPVVKILDYGKYKFQAQKKAAEARKKQKTVEVKEIKMRPSIDTHDYDVKMRAARRFLDEGDKVKMTLRFRGREMAHQELGLQLLFRVRDDLTDHGEGRSRSRGSRAADDHDPGAVAEDQRPRAAGGRSRRRCSGAPDGISGGRPCLGRLSSLILRTRLN